MKSFDSHWSLIVFSLVVLFRANAVSEDWVMGRLSSYLSHLVRLCCPHFDDVWDLVRLNCNLKRRNGEKIKIFLKKEKSCKIVQIKVGKEKRFVMAK